MVDDARWTVTAVCRARSVAIGRRPAPTNGQWPMAVAAWSRTTKDATEDQRRLRKRRKNKKEEEKQNKRETLEKTETTHTDTPYL